MSCSARLHAGSAERMPRHSVPGPAPASTTVKSDGSPVDHSREDRAEQRTDLR
jgi:hypothetical protein